MMKRIYNKYKVFLALVLLITLVFSTIYLVDYQKFKSKLVDRDGTYAIKVSHLIADKDKLDSNATIDDTNENHLDSIIYFVDQYVPLTKDGDYLYVNLDEYTNDLLLKDVTDVAYSKNNVFGEEIDGCSYDKNTKILKIPYSYYDKNNRDQYIPIQVEIESLLTQKEINNVKTKYNVKKLVTSSKTASNELLELNAKISLSNYINGSISKEDIFIYLNNFKEPLEKEQFSYDYKTKVVTIDYPSILINNVDIKLGNNIIKNVFAYWNPEEKTASTMTSWGLTGAPSSTNYSLSNVSLGSRTDSNMNFFLCTEADNNDCFTSTGYASWNWQY